jgi:Fic family protein
MERPIASPSWIAESTGISPATINAGLNHLVQLGIAHEMTGRLRRRIFGYGGYIAIMNKGME